MLQAFTKFKSRFLALGAIATLSATLCAAPRVFVASYGIDDGDCALAAPCRSFNYAHDRVDPEGEIIALDTAGYGVMTITKSVTVSAVPSAVAIVPPTGGSGITIDAAGAKVVLRNLAVRGVGGTSGVSVNRVRQLYVENCIFSNLSAYGIFVGAPGAEVLITDSIARNIAGTGVRVEGNAVATLDNVRVEGNSGSGVHAHNGASVAVRNSVLASNGAHGAAAESTSGSTTTRLVVERSQVHANGYGLYAFAINQAGARVDLQASGNVIARNGSHGIWAFVVASPGAINVTATDNLVTAHPDHGIYGNVGSGISGGVTMILSGNTVTRNGVGIVNQSVTVRSRQNNTVSDNATDTQGAITPLNGI